MKRESALRILVIDDDPDVCEVLRRFLSDRGYQVETAADGKAGLTALRRDPADVVLLDLELPGLSGLDVMRNIERDDIDVEIITISGHPAAERLLGPDSLELGAADFISKPFDFSELEGSLLVRLSELEAGVKR